jgi:hypothetical protein
VADQKAYDSYVTFSTIATPGNLNLQEVPKHVPLVVGQPVKISLRGVVGFGEVIIKLVATLDAELSICDKAENILVSKFRDWAASTAGRAKNNLKRDPSARSKQLHSLLRLLEFPDPARVDEIEALLLNERILKVNYV